MANLGGRVIACLEARHATAMADLVARHHGVTYPAPCLREIHEPDAAATRLAVDLLCGDQIDDAVFLTGVGVRTILEGARRLGREAELLAGLAKKRVAVRGPKTQNALRHRGVRVDLVAPPPFTSQCLGEALAETWDLRDRRVLVQLYGSPVPAFTDALSELGAWVTQVAPYRWERPMDEESVTRLIEDLGAGWVDVLAATSAVQVEHLFAIARDYHYETDLRAALTQTRPLVVAAQGIVCAAAFEREGVKVDLISPRASMGSLVLEIARHMDQARTAQVPAPQPTRQGTVAILATRDVAPVAGLRRVVEGLGAGSTVSVLAGQDRRVERALEQAAVQQGLAVRAVIPSSHDRHPADDLIRRADYVLVLTRGGPGSKRLIQLAERYAKPVRVLPLTVGQDGVARP